MERFTAVALGLLLGACSPGTTGQIPSAEAAASGAVRKHREAKLSVMTRNLYVGVNLFRIASARSPQELAAIAAAMWRTAQETDFPSRARLLADEVAGAGPDVLVLEEAYLYRTGPGATCAGQSLPATAVAYDFLTTLEAELAARGLDYRRVAVNELFDGQLCAFDGTAAPIDVRITDRDAILVRGGVEARNARTGRYAVLASFDAGGLTIVQPRGWATAEINIGGGWVQLAMTHLETEAAPPVQEAQARELLDVVAAGIEPVVLAGDFNSGPELAGVTTTYADFLAAGFRDPWPQLHRRDPGLTCCLDETLRSGAFTQRVDLALYRGSLEPERAFRTGLSATTATGLRASDHAGLVVHFESEDE